MPLDDNGERCIPRDSIGVVVSTEPELMIDFRGHSSVVLDEEDDLARIRKIHTATECPFAIGDKVQLLQNEDHLDGILVCGTVGTVEATRDGSVSVRFGQDLVLRFDADEWSGLKNVERKFEVNDSVEITEDIVINQACTFIQAGSTGIITKIEHDLLACVKLDNFGMTIMASFSQLKLKENT